MWRSVLSLALPMLPLVQAQTEIVDGSFTEPEVSSLLTIDKTSDGACDITWFWSFNTVITGFDIVFSETDENDDDFNSIFANALQLTSVSYASAMASNALNSDPIVDTPAWAYMVFRDSQLDEEPVADGSTGLPLGTNTAIVTDYDMSPILDVDTLTFTRAPFNFGIDGPPLSCTNTILQGTVCADKKVVNLPVFRFRTESTTLCNAFSSVQSMEPTLFFQIFAPTLQPPPPATIASDPHVLGLHKQQYDVLGTSGSIYALLNDFSFFVNARFATAYTTGVHVDANHVAKPMRPSGTWIDQVGIMLVIDMSTDDSSSPGVEESDEAPQDAGESSVATVSVVISTQLRADQESSEEKPRVGTLELNGAPFELVAGNYDIAFEGFPLQDSIVSLRVEDYDAFRRITVTSPELELAVDIVHPPAAWEVQPNEVAQYSHLNLHMGRLVVSDAIHGLIGVSARLKYDKDGHPIMQGHDKNGAGIIDGLVSDYCVEDILASKFKYSVFTEF